jgi:hypothetical protein
LSVSADRIDQEDNLKKIGDARVSRPKMGQTAQNDQLETR